MSNSPSWFLGLPVTDAEDLLGAVSDAPEGIRITHPEDLHLTLSFLGPVGEAAGVRAFDHAAARVSLAIDATTGPPILLGPPRVPWAICASFAEGREELAALITTLSDPCREQAGVAAEGRVAVPHCTLAAIDRSVKAEQRKELEAWARSVATEGFRLRFETLSLYTRAARGSPSRYRRVRRQSLSSTSR